jgi:hypothetical protein
MKRGDFVVLAFGQTPPSMINDPRRPMGMLDYIGEQTTEIDNALTKQREVVHTFGWYLRKFISDAKAREVTPIVCTNVAFNGWLFGQVMRVHASSNRWSAAVAGGADVAFLPLNEFIARRYDALGPEKVTTLFGNRDSSHTNENGAEINAQCFVAMLKGIEGNPFTPYFAPSAKDILPADLADHRHQPAKAIDDTEPEVAATVKRIVDQTREGAFDQDLFTPELGKSLQEWLSADGAQELRSFGELKITELTGKREDAGTRMYRYRLVFERETIMLHIGFNQAGKISGLF